MVASQKWQVMAQRDWLVSAHGPWLLAAGPAQYSAFQKARWLLQCSEVFMANTSALQQLTNRPILLKVEAINIHGKKCLEVVSFQAKNITAMPSSVAFDKVWLLPRQDPIVPKTALSFSACPRHRTH